MEQGRIKTTFFETASQPVSQQHAAFANIAQWSRSEPPQHREEAKDSPLHDYYTCHVTARRLPITTTCSHKPRMGCCCCCCDPIYGKRWTEARHTDQLWRATAGRQSRQEERIMLMKQKQEFTNSPELISRGSVSNFQGSRSRRSVEKIKNKKWTKIFRQYKFHWTSPFDIFLAYISPPPPPPPPRLYRRNFSMTFHSSSPIQHTVLEIPPTHSTAAASRITTTTSDGGGRARCVWPPHGSEKSCALSCTGKSFSRLSCVRPGINETHVSGWMKLHVCTANSG